VRGPAHILFPLSILTAALAFAVAGCGGTNQSAEEQWANDVCTPVLNWNKQIKQLASDAKSEVSSPQAGTIDTLKTDAQKAVTTTNQLKTDLGNLPPAPGESGQTAKETLTSFAAQMSQVVTALKSNIGALSSSSSASQAATVLAGAAGQISTLTTQAKSTLSSVKQTSSKLKSGFEKASACKELKSS
jgi:hypothetical protein